MNLDRLSPQQCDAIWSAKLHEPSWMTEARSRLKLIASESNTPFGKWLQGECAMQSISTMHVRELEGQLGMDHTMRNILRNITQRLRQKIPGFPLARIAIAVRRAANPINPDIYTAERVQRSQHLIQALKRGLRSDLDSFSPEQRTGLLLMHAAYGGGLMDAAQLNALLGVTHEQIEWVAGIPEIRLPLSIRGKQGAEYRQWFPDPATLALLIRCNDDVREMKKGTQRRDQKLKCIHSFLMSVGMPEQSLPLSLTDVLDLLRMQMQLRLPQVLVNYACRKEFVAQPLRPSSWGGLFDYADLEDPFEIYGDGLSTEAKADPVEAPRWLLDLCAQIRSGQRVEPILQAEASTESIELIVSWALWMQGGASAYGSRVGLGTIARYVRALGAALVSQLDDMRLFDLEPDALEIIYESMLEAQIGEGKQRTLGKAIYEFHAFLVHCYKYPPISPYSVLGIGQGVPRVDARILSEDQFQSLLLALGSCGLELRTPRLVTAARLIAILGFRLGLRRNEALKLRLCDLHLPSFSIAESTRIQQRHPDMRRLSREELAELALPVDLLIRPHTQRGLKTQNATRRLSLRALLEPEELELLCDWHRQRQDEETLNPTSGYLFCIPQLKTQWISEAYLFNAVQRCMRAVTGNELVHYHHLRHSCATWLSLKIMGAASGLSFEVIFQGLPRTVRWLNDDYRLRSLLLSTQKGPTRRIVHLVSAILGHSSPKITLLHYVHSLPQMITLAWQWNPRNWLFTAANVTSIAGVSQPTMRSETSGGVPRECRALLDIVGRIRPLKGKRRSQAKIARPAPMRVNENWAIERIQRIGTMLAYASYAEEHTQHVNLDWLEFSAEDRVQMLDRADYIRSLQSRSHSGSRGGGKHRLKATRQTDGSTYISLQPEMPAHGGIDAVAGYAQRLYNLLDGPDSMRVQRVVDDFVERCWATDTTLRFYRDRDEEHVRDYLWLLAAIGVPARSIELFTYDACQPKITKSYWRRTIGSLRRVITEHIPENPKVQNLHLGIRVQMELKDKAGNTHSGSALRYLMLMASIDWHFRG